MNDFPSWVGQLLTGLGGAAGTFVLLRGKLSAVGTEVAKDKHERAQLERDMAELQQLRSLTSGHVEKIARLEAEKKYLKRDMQRLILLLEKRAPYLPKDVREAVETDFASFDSGGQDK